MATTTRTLKKGRSVRKTKKAASKVARKRTTGKTAAKSSTAKKSTSSRRKASSAKRGERRYGSLASRKVKKAMEELKEGTLRSSRSGEKVKSRKQAIAIGLSEARAEGGKVPEAPKS